MTCLQRDVRRAGSLVYVAPNLGGCSFIGDRGHIMDSALRFSHCAHRLGAFFPFIITVRTRVVRHWVTRIATSLNEFRRCVWSLVNLTALTPRQTEIVLRLFDGQPVATIVGARYLGRSTVRSNSAYVFGMFDVHSQFELIGYLRS
jgi:DNA-binding NarL/FixJ family response regulator